MSGILSAGASISTPTSGRFVATAVTGFMCTKCETRL